MKKVATWVIAISAIALVITWAVMGIGVYEMDENTIRTTTYISIPFLVLMLGGVIYIKWGTAKCPYCGKPRLTNGKYCSYCGKEIKYAFGGGALEKEKWVLCPICNNKTRIKVRPDTVLENFPLFCPKCKRETIINVTGQNVVVSNNSAKGETK
jgi:DNA-directed RNA polymerase subunit RPC12/RpoP